jgi:hypothetical protein
VAAREAERDRELEEGVEPRVTDAAGLDEANVAGRDARHLGELALRETKIGGKNRFFKGSGQNNYLFF